MTTSVAPAVEVFRAPTRRDSAEFSLVARAQQGDEQAFAALYETHRKRVYSVCLLMTGNVATAEDLTQDTFLQAFRNIKAFRGDAAFSTWLHRVAINTVLMSLRRFSPPQMSLDDPDRLDSTLLQRRLAGDDLALLGVAERMLLVRGMNQLPEGCRLVFILHEVEGYEHHEIARLLDCSIGNSKSQLYRARLKFRKFLLRTRGGSGRLWAREMSGLS